MTIDYVTWKIVPKLDYLNKEGIFLTVSFCEFGLYLTLMVGSRLSALAQFKIITEVWTIQIEYDLTALHQR